MPIPYVVYWNNIPSPYMVDRFNALARRGSVEFEAWFNERTQPDRSWHVDENDWCFRYRFIPSIGISRLRLHVAPLMWGRIPDVVASLYGEPAFVIGWIAAHLRGAKTCFRVLATHDNWVRRHPIKEALKRQIFRRVDAVETPGQDGKAFAMRYGTPASKIHYATHTVDVPFFKDESTKGREQCRESLRNELGLKGTTFLYVGRLWKGKGIYFLIDAFSKVQCASSGDVSLLILGDGQGEREFRKAARHLQNVVFAGFKHKAELPKFYACSDVFVFPTLGDPYGLVVDEAMACSLPIISTSAAGEIHDRVEEGVNGYIVPPEDSEALALRMLQLARDPGLRDRMGNVSAEKIKDHTPEKWAEDFERIVFQLVPGGAG